MYHTPVMLNEILKIISPQNDKKYLDCTFGAGGHSNAILKTTQTATLTALDIDPNVYEFVYLTKNKYGNRFKFLLNNFSEIDKIFDQEKFDGIILDLGVSSMQFDIAQRGFSFNKEGNLDMRMGQSNLTAFDVIHQLSQQELADIIYKFGDEVQSKKIAEAIVKARKLSSINSTLDLANIVKNAMHYKPTKINPVTKTFQAIRIYVNQELENLKKFLINFKKILNLNAIVIIISFHSLEDRIVKNFFKHCSIKKYTSEGEFLKIITKKPISPSKLEIASNKRARSAKLRAAIRIV